MKKLNDNKWLKFYVLLNVIVAFGAFRLFPEVFHNEDGTYKLGSMAILVPGGFLVSTIIWLLIVMIYSSFSKKRESEERFFKD